LVSLVAYGRGCIASAEHGMGVVVLAVPKGGAGYCSLPIKCKQPEGA